MTKIIDWVEEAKKSWKLGYQEGYGKAIHDLINRREEIDKYWTRYGGGRTYGEFVSDYLKQQVAPSLPDQGIKEEVSK